MHNLKQPQQFFPYYNPSTGLVEIVDSISGNVIGVQRTKQDLWKDKESHMIPIMLDGREIWIEKGVSPDRVPSRHGSWAYSNIMAEIISQRVLNGEPLTKICKDPTMPPYSVVCRWRSENDEFSKLLEDARRYRAEHFHDNILELSEDKETDEDEVARKKLEIESKKWLAEKGDRVRYGQTANKDGVSSGLVLVVNTGILRPGDPGFEGVKDVTNEVKISYIDATTNVSSGRDSAGGIGDTT